MSSPDSSPDRLLVAQRRIEKLQKQRDTAAHHARKLLRRRVEAAEIMAQMADNEEESREKEAEAARQVEEAKKREAEALRRVDFLNKRVDSMGMLLEALNGRYEWAQKRAEKAEAEVVVLRRQLRDIQPKTGRKRSRERETQDEGVGAEHKELGERIAESVRRAL